MARKETEMDLVMKPLHLEKETRALLETIRTAGFSVSPPAGLCVRASRFR